MCNWIRKWWESTENLVLEYSPFETILGLNGNQVLIEARTALYNPQDVTIRLRTEHIYTTFGNVTENTVNGRVVQFDIAPHAFVYSHARGIMVNRNGAPSIPGRIDWCFKFGKVKKNGEADCRFTLALRGNLNLHFFQHGPESRWGQDDDVPAPIVDYERIDDTEGAEFHLDGAHGH